MPRKYKLFYNKQNMTQMKLVVVQLKIVQNTKQQDFQFL